MQRIYRTALGAGVSLLAVASASPALAQSAPAAAPAPVPAATSGQSDGGIQDIVVTAQRRSQNLQKTSVAIDVLSAQDVARVGVTQVRDLSVAVPALQISQGGAATQIFIRGVGDIGTTAQSNPGVAFNVDGVYVARPAGVEGNFFDIERVEVLKGPQGTLYGRNATGGAINVITRKPVLGETEVVGAIEAGNYQSLSAEAAVNLPLGTDFAIRAAGQLVSREGYVNYRFGDDHHQSARLQALWEPSDRLKVRFSGDFVNVNGGGSESVPLTPVAGISPWTSVTDPRVTPTYNALAAASGLCAPPFPGSPGMLSSYVGGCPAVPLPIGPGGALVPVQFRQLVTPQTGAQGSTHNQFWSISGELDYQLGFATLTVLPAYRHVALDYTTYPADFLFNIAPGHQPETSKQTSLEVRLGNDTRALKWVVGAYYFNEDQFGVNQVNAGVVQDVLLVSSYHTRAYAGFGQATLSVTDRLRVIGGARYTSDQKEAGSTDSTTYYLQGSAAFAGLVGAGACNPAPVRGTGLTGCALPPIPIGRKTFDKFNWKGGVEYDVAEHSMLFATASTGFKSGGFSPGVDVGGVRNSYQPETLLSFEAGARNRFLDNRLQINIDAFYYKYKDHQEPVISQDALGTIVQELFNAGNGRIYGGSVDAVFKPTPVDTLRLNSEYTNSKYTNFIYFSPIIPGSPLFVPPGASGCAVTNLAATQKVDCSGFPLTRAPEWTGLVSYSHGFILASGGRIEAEANMRFASSRYLSTDYLPLSHVGPFQTYNASLTYRTASEHITITAFVRNISNEAVYTNAQRSPFVVGFSTASIAPPRTYGARLGFQF